MTSLPLIIAEELDADWAKVKIVPAPLNEKIYGNPGFGGMMYTAGSNAVTSYYQPLRMVGAQVRRVLLDNAARKWGVAGRGTDHRAERGRACQIGPQAELWRHCGLRRSAGQGAGNQARSAQEDCRLPSHRQGCDACRTAEQGQRHRRHTASTCRCRECCTARCCVRRSKDRSRTRSTTPRRRRCRCHRGHQASARCRRRRGDRVGCVLGAAGADRAPSPGPGPAWPGASTATRGTTPSRPTRRTFRDRRATGAHKAMPVAHSRTRPARSKANIAATMPITRRWSR